VQYHVSFSPAIVGTSWQKSVMWPIDIFRAGTHTSSDGLSRSFSLEQVRGIAATYNPDVRKAGLVEGHPPENDQGNGYVSACFCEGDLLRAVPKISKPTFAAAIMTGEYPSLSVRLLPPSHPENPSPEHFYLDHVGLLKRGQQPGVAGLRSPNTYAFSETPEGVLDFSVPFALPEFEMSRQAAQMVRELVQEGRLLAVDQENWVKLLSTMPQSFEHGDWLTGWLKRLPIQVPLGDRLAKPGQVDFSSNPADLAQKARDYVVEQKRKGLSVSFATAVQHLKGAK